MKSFTLIETIVTIAVFVIIMGAVFASVLMLYRTHSYAWQQSLAIDEARRGIKIMVKEVREAKPGDDGSYLIEKAGDKEFIFYSDIDKDGDTERVRYFLASTDSGDQTKECVVFSTGASCSVVFDDFLLGTLTSAQVKVSVEGDFGWNDQEYAEIYADGVFLEDICRTGCSDCAGDWQGSTTFDITEQALDGSIQFLADASSRVDAFCNWQEPNHSMKVKFEFSWEQEISDADSEFKKGVINPTSFPAEYPLDQEELSTISYYVRNAPPIFEYFYFDEELNQFIKIEDYPAKLIDTKLIKLLLIINVDPNRSPQNLELESSVQLRNLKE